MIDEPQAGFRKGYSTTDNIFRSKQLVRSIYVAKEAFIGIFVDLRRALDSISDKIAGFSSRERNKQ